MSLLGPVPHQQKKKDLRPHLPCRRRWDPAPCLTYERREDPALSTLLKKKDPHPLPLEQGQPPSATLPPEPPPRATHKPPVLSHTTQIL